jgi:hypothetical protein
MLASAPKLITVHAAYPKVMHTQIVLCPHDAHPCRAQDGTVRFTQEAIATCQLPTGTAKYRNRLNSKVGTLLKFHDGTPNCQFVHQCEMPTVNVEMNSNMPI